MKSIFSYSDYRAYLNDFYNDRKTSGEYSYRHFSQKAELSSPNYLTLVMSGKRDLTVTNIHQFSKALDLRADETEFFEVIVHLTQAQTELEKKFYENRRRKLLSLKPKEVFKVTPTVEVLADWSTTGILVLAHGLTVTEARIKICSELGLRMDEIDIALNRLIDLGYLVKSDANLLELRSPQLTFHDPKSVSRAQSAFLSAQLDLSRQAFRKTYADKSGKFLSHSLTVPEGAIEIIHHRMLAFIEELTNAMDATTTPTSSHLAQINVQIFHPKKWKGH